MCLEDTNFLEMNLHLNINISDVNFGRAMCGV